MRLFLFLTVLKTFPDAIKAICGSPLHFLQIGPNSYSNNVNNNQSIKCYYYLDKVCPVDNRGGRERRLRPASGRRHTVQRRRQRAAQGVVAAAASSSPSHHQHRRCRMRLLQKFVFRFFELMEICFRKILIILLIKRKSGWKGVGGERRRMPRNSEAVHWCACVRKNKIIYRSIVKRPAAYRYLLPTATVAGIGTFLSQVPVPHMTPIKNMKLPHMTP
jgi:hypothetical protein